MNAERPCVTVIESGGVCTGSNSSEDVGGVAKCLKKRVITCLANVVSSSCSAD